MAISCVAGPRDGAECRKTVVMQFPEPSRLASAVVITASSLLAAVLVAALAVHPRAAAALPTYAEKERKQCGYCHVNPAGGSVLNARGRAYEDNGYSFKK
jgi:hypothetical protein